MRTLFTHGAARSVGRVAAAIAACGAGAIAQQPQQPPVFQASTQLVEVDARVTDRDGRPVDDLTIDDFEIVERGSSQPIRGLYFVAAGAADDPTAAPLVTWRGEGALTPSAVPPSVARQTWVFVFDLNHLTPGGGFERAQQAVQTFIRERFRDGDIGGVVAGSRMVNNRLTSVRAELEAAAAGVRPLPDARTRQVELTRESPRLRDEAEAFAIAAGDRDAIQRAVVRVCAEDPTVCNNADLMVREKAQRLRSDIMRASLDTLNAMTALANGLARIPGPKTVVFLSDGFVLQEMEGALRSTVGQASRAAARVYAIDARGLNRGPSADIGDRAAAEDGVGAPARFDAAADGANSLAVDTGGFVIRNENNVARALTRIADDAGRYYVLVYEPQGLKLDGQYHPIEVRVKRPGLTVRARRGYLALPASQLLIPQPIRKIP